MLPHVQKLPLNERSSFVARTYRTPNFEVGWHQHPEYELILFTEGAGLSFVGDAIERFEPGNIYFLGPNLPHTFQKQGEQVTSAIVVQFLDSAFGEVFFDLPENTALRTLFKKSVGGMKVDKLLQHSLAADIMRMETDQGLPRLLNLLNCLHRMAETGAYRLIATPGTHVVLKSDPVINEIFRFTIENFRERITLEQVAEIACLSVPAFCHYFKKVTKKTYVTFLNELRLSHASSALTDTSSPVSRIAYDCGFGHPGHFYKLFYRAKGLTPLQYRKAFQSNTLHISAG